MVDNSGGWFKNRNQMKNLPRLSISSSNQPKKSMAHDLGHAWVTGIFSSCTDYLVCVRGGALLTY